MPRATQGRALATCLVRLRGVECIWSTKLLETDDLRSHTSKRARQKLDPLQQSEAYVWQDRLATP